MYKPNQKYVSEVKIEKLAKDINGLTEPLSRGGGEVVTLVLKIKNNIVA